MILSVIRERCLKNLTTCMYLIIITMTSATTSATITADFKSNQQIICISTFHTLLMRSGFHDVTSIYSES